MTSTQKEAVRQAIRDGRVYLVSSDKGGAYWKASNAYQKRLHLEGCRFVKPTSRLADMPQIVYLDSSRCAVPERGLR